jgi:hypothetical protein
MLHFCFREQNHDHLTNLAKGFRREAGRCPGSGSLRKKLHAYHLFIEAVIEQF